MSILADCLDFFRLQEAPRNPPETSKKFQEPPRKSPKKSPKTSFSVGQELLESGGGGAHAGGVFNNDVDYDDAICPYSALTSSSPSSSMYVWTS